MRTIKTLGILLIIAVICFAAVAVGVNASCGATAGNTATCTTSAVDSSGSNLLVSSSGYFNSAGTTAVTDSKSNAYTGLTAGTTGFVGMKLFYKTSTPTVGSGHTFTSTLTGGFPSNCAVTFSGLSTSSFLSENGATATATTVGTGTLTVSVGDLVVTALGFNTIGTASINNSFTLVTGQVNFSSGNTFGCAIAYKVATSTSESATWTLTASSSLVARSAAFAQSGGTANYRPQGFTF